MPPGGIEPPHALYALARRAELPVPFAVLGYARTDWDDDAFRAHARRAIEKSASAPVDEGRWAAFAAGLQFLCGDFEGRACFTGLAERLARIDRDLGVEGRRLYYCATPPSAFPVIVRRLGECRLETGAGIVIEKPFGRDLASARDLNRDVHEVFDERQVFRIDHYLGKETVQNILVFRFFNSMFEHAWNRRVVDHVRITVAETLGVEGRGAYYEQAGALRDMVQNHVLQVLSFVAMEPPKSFDPDAIRDAQADVLRALRPFEPRDVVRGQYTAGEIDGRGVPGYREEADVAPDSGIETFVAIRARIDDRRWDGVPFLLRAGKRLGRRATEVVLVFRHVPEHLDRAAGERVAPGHLTIRIQPDEGMSLSFQAKEPGEGFRPRPVRMDLTYDPSLGTVAEPYERLLRDAMVGDQTLFPRVDGVDRAWEVVAPVLERPPRLHPYPAGGRGPQAAARLIPLADRHPDAAGTEEARTGAVGRATRR